MADEARVTSSLNILKRSGSTVVMDYQSRPGAFTADVTGTKGPSPGAITALSTGSDVDLSQLTTPGLCRIMNLDDEVVIEYGISDGSVFHPLGEVLPGESYVLRLSRNLGEEHDQPGTGTTGTVNQLMVRGVGADAVALVEAFEK